MSVKRISFPSAAPLAFASGKSRVGGYGAYRLFATRLFNLISKRDSGTVPSVTDVSPIKANKYRPRWNYFSTNGTVKLPVGIKITL
jgi:hypothetical protein